MSTRLLDIYRENVDAIFKLLHWPTAYSLVTTSSSEDVEGQSLKWAIYFMALCTASDDEIESKEMWTKQCRLATEIALVKAGLLSSMSLVVLQAFVIYLVSYHDIWGRFTAN